MNKNRLNLSLNSHNFFLCYSHECTNKNSDRHEYQYIHKINIVPPEKNICVLVAKDILY